MHPKDEDARSNMEHKKGTKRWVPTPCSITMLYNPTDLWQQEHVAMTKHAHRVRNLANGDVGLIGMFDKTWKCFWCSIALISNFQICIKSHLLHWWNIRVRKFLFKALSLHFVPCLRSIWWWRIIVYQHFSILQLSCLWLSTVSKGLGSNNYPLDKLHQNFIFLKLPIRNKIYTLKNNMCSHNRLKAL